MTALSRLYMLKSKIYRSRRHLSPKWLVGKLLTAFGVEEGAKIYFPVILLLFLFFV
jgi:hypothetical protein